MTIAQTPRQRWGTCCPYDPACEHSFLSVEELQRHLDTPMPVPPIAYEAVTFGGPLPGQRWAGEGSILHVVPDTGHYRWRRFGMILREGGTEYGREKDYFDGYAWVWEPDREAICAHILDALRLLYRLATLPITA